MPHASAIWLSSDGWTVSPTARLPLRLPRRPDSRRSLSRAFSGKSEFPVIPWGDRAHAPWDTTAPVLPVTDNVWPGVAAGRRDDPTAGPTGVPWLDSNGWYIQLARARDAVAVWVLFDPPGKGDGGAGPELPAGRLRCRSGGRPLGDLPRRQLCGRAWPRRTPQRAPPGNGLRTRSPSSRSTASGSRIGRWAWSG